jgi:hypothetical protein
MPDNESRRRLDAWLRSVDALLGEDDDTPPALVGKLWVRLRKERDLELHVRTGWLFGTEYVQLVDFVPSTGTHGDAVLVERRLLGEVLHQLHGLHRHLDGTARVA